MKVRQICMMVLLCGPDRAIRTGFVSCGSCLKWVWERGVRGTSVGTGVAGSCERNARRIAATEEADCRDRQEISFTLNQESYETGYTFLSAPVPLLQEGAGLSGGTAAAGTVQPHRNQDDRRTGRTRSGRPLRLLLRTDILRRGQESARGRYYARRGGGRTPYGPRRAIGGKPFLRKKE